MSLDRGESTRVPTLPAARCSDAHNQWLWLGVIAIVVYGAFATWPGLFAFLGLNHYGIWFLDLFALLASNDAITSGLNPYLANPLDYFHRPHVYSHWWLHLRDLGLTRADTLWLGLSLVSAFFLTAWWRLRPRSRRQLIWYVAILCSPPVLLAIDRCNNDLVIFLLLAPVVPLLLSERPYLRWVGPVLVAVAAGLKYYPAAACLVVLAGGDRKEVRLRFLITLLLLAVVFCGIVEDLARFSPITTRSLGLMSFGATGLLLEIGRAGWAANTVCAALGCILVVLAWFQRELGEWEPSADQQSRWLYFLLGASLLTGCFLTNISYWYRLIFGLWLAPFLWDVTHRPETPEAVRRLAKRIVWLLLFVFWWSLLWTFVLNRFADVLSGQMLARLLQVTFLIEQPFDWLFVFCLLVFLTHFVRRRCAFLGGGRS